MKDRCCITDYAERAYNSSFPQALSLRRIHSAHSYFEQMTNINPSARFVHNLAVSLVGLTAIALYEQTRRVFPTLPTTTKLARSFADESDSDSDSNPPDLQKVPVEY